MERKKREDFHDDYGYERYIDELFKESYKCGYDKGRKEGETKERLDTLNSKLTEKVLVDTQRERQCYRDGYARGRQEKEVKGTST